MNSIFNEIMILFGYRIYCKIIAGKPNAEFVFIATRDAGDLMFLRYSYGYVEEIYGESAILLANGKNAAIIDALGIRHYIPLGQLEIAALAKAYYYYCNTKMTHLHDIYNWCMFDMNNTTDNYIRDIPKYSDNRDAIDKLFEHNSLRKGQTVVLAPYEQGITAKRLPLIPGIVWEMIASVLLDKGFDVCTNCKGTDNEPAIKGTRAVFPKISDLEAFVECCGYYIAVRSGFCDFVNNSDAKKIVFYPNKEYIDYFGMKNYRKDNDIREYVYGDLPDGDWDVIINECVDFLMNERE